MERCAATNKTVTTINSFPCLDATDKLPLPLSFGDPPVRQVPLFVAWEAYHQHFLTARRQRGQHKAPSGAAGTMKDVTFIQIGANCGKNTYGCAAGAILQ